MLQKVYFLSFGSIFLRKRFLLSYFFCKFVARIYQAEASKRKKDLNTSSIPDSYSPLIPQHYNLTLFISS